MPPALLAECRGKADERLRAGAARPRSWAGAAAIVLLWLACAVLLWLAWTQT
jgi:hypothetical protein